MVTLCGTALSVDRHSCGQTQTGLEVQQPMTELTRPLHTHTPYQRAAGFDGA